MTARPRTLLRELVLRLMLPLLAIVAITGALGAYTAQRLTDRTFDHWLLDAARSLATQVHFDGALARVDLAGDGAAILAYDMLDRTYYSVRQGEQLLAGQPDIPSSGAGETSYPDGVTFDAHYAGQPVRVARVTLGEGSGQARVLVAETLLKRHGVRVDLGLMLIPLVVLLVAAAGAILLALRWTLRPLETIAARWRAAADASLQPVSLADVPRELAPFANALNALLERIQALLTRERRFAANAAHQIRTPLAGLQLGLSRAAEAPDLASARAVIGELSQSTQRTSRLLQQLMALGRLDPENAHDLTLQPTDLVALAHDVGASYLDGALARDVGLELDAPDAPIHAPVHADLLSEALGNLVDNALRYTPAGGRVVISFDSAPPSLIVSDSGPGIPAEMRDAVFERFVRGRNASGDGSGLGLAIVREIAALHNADVTLTDSPLGGLSVRIRFRSR